ncbi:MAG: FMN-binding protein [Treponema sp.]|nr:FMN-binding protein [Treponema sp.]
MKNDFILPVLVLSLICFVVSGALAFINSKTQPVIEAAAKERAEKARRDIIPQADDFELLEIEGLPKRITDVYRATNNTGFVFMITTHGYAVEDIKLICGIDMDGKIIKTATLSQNETQGLGTPIFEQPHAGQYWNRDKNGIESIAAITGATITSNAYKNGIRDAFMAFEIVLQKEAQR